jgi:hypothetical protein
MNFRCRLGVRHLKNRSAVCKKIATRFVDVGPVRTWYCAEHHKGNKDGNSAKEIEAGAPMFSLVSALFLFQGRSCGTMHQSAE